MNNKETIYSFLGFLIRQVDEPYRQRIFNDLIDYYPEYSDDLIEHWRFLNILTEVLNDAPANSE